MEAGLLGSRENRWRKVSCVIKVFQCLLLQRGPPGRPLRLSTIFYMGLEGLGGIDMETDENENV